MHDLIVVGTGPCGLSAAVEAHAAGLDALAVDRDCLCHTLQNLPTHMTFFSTPELLEIGGLPFALDHKPVRREMLTYYRRVIQRCGLPLRLYTPVLEVRRAGGGFRLATPGGDLAARAVCLATGFFDHPRLLGVDGEDLPHVSHYYTEGHPYFDRDVVVVGARNSAAEAVLDLHRCGARVTLVHRGDGLAPSVKYWLKPDVENRIREGSVRALFRAVVRSIRPGSVTVAAAGEPQRTIEVPAHHVFLMTGYTPDHGLFAGAGGGFDADGRPRVDPQTYESDIPGLFLAGVQADPGAIIEEGRGHGPRIARALAGG